MKANLLSFRRVYDGLLAFIFGARLEPSQLALRRAWLGPTELGLD
jgi:hypothetical protein